MHFKTAPPCETKCSSEVCSGSELKHYRRSIKAAHKKEYLKILDKPAQKGDRELLSSIFRTLKTDWCVQRSERTWSLVHCIDKLIPRSIWQMNPVPTPGRVSDQLALVNCAFSPSSLLCAV